jgi:hypothetical protein
MDYFLKFTSQKAADAVLFAKDTILVDGVSEVVMRPKYTAIDVIGTIYKPTGNITTVDDVRTPEMAAVTGYHVNVRHDAEAPELDSYVIQVATPSRVWA